MTALRGLSPHLSSAPTTFELTPVDNDRLAGLCGQFNQNLKQIESHFGVGISNRGHLFSISGDPSVVPVVETVLKRLYDRAKEGIDHQAIRFALTAVEPIDDKSGEDSSGNQASERARNKSERARNKNVRLKSVKSSETDNTDELDADEKELTIRTRKSIVRGENRRQREYIQHIMTSTVTFGIGPAGTGKTFLAVACATNALLGDEVRRIVLVRPAVEAGERLGFLPGDIGQKVDPYLRPLYDALYEMLGFEKVARLLEKGVIELAPLAYMRGRTLNDSFVILDEAQNTTVEQMKMFLTRTGFNSRVVITGDVTQIDLPKGQKSGLIHSAKILEDVEGIAFTRFQPRDVVRHPMVQKIVEAYEAQSDD